MLAWGLYTNLENSLKDFLDAQIITDSVTDINSVSIPVRVGKKQDNDWSLPCITVYQDIETSEKLEIGSNSTDDKFVIIIDIYATTDRERKDVARWLKEEIKNGFAYYAYSYNALTPEVPTKVAGKLVNVDFLTNGEVSLGQNISEVDSHRHQITINTYFTGVAI